jgi:hypothetical protein
LVETAEPFMAATAPSGVGMEYRKPPWALSLGRDIVLLQHQPLVAVSGSAGQPPERLSSEAAKPGISTSSGSWPVSSRMAW